MSLTIRDPGPHDPAALTPEFDSAHTLPIEGGTVTVEEVSGVSYVEATRDLAPTTPATPVQSAPAAPPSVAAPPPSQASAGDQLKAARDALLEKASRTTLPADWPDRTIALAAGAAIPALAYALVRGARRLVGRKRPAPMAPATGPFAPEAITVAGAAPI